MPGKSVVWTTLGVRLLFVFLARQARTAWFPNVVTALLMYFFLPRALARTVIRMLTLLVILRYALTMVGAVF